MLRENWIFIGLMPLTLVVVAGLQMVRASALDQSPWKGGGFGMFSSVKHPSSRFLRIHMVTGGRRIPAEVPAELQELEGELRTSPEPERLRVLVQAMLGMKWVEVKADTSVLRGRSTLESPEALGASMEMRVSKPRLRALPSHSRDESTQPVRVDEVSVSLYESIFDRGSLELEARLLMRVSVRP